MAIRTFSNYLKNRRFVKYFYKIAEKVQNGNDKSQQPKTYENEFIQMDSSPTPFR